LKLSLFFVFRLVFTAVLVRIDMKIEKRVRAFVKAS
jgi:hypothetical protein